MVTFSIIKSSSVIRGKTSQRGEMGHFESLATLFYANANGRCFNVLMGANALFKTRFLSLIRNNNGKEHNFRNKQIFVF